MPDLNKIIDEHDKHPHLRELQKKLAKEVTIFVHSKEELDEAIKASNILFGKSTAKDLQQLNETTFLNIFEGVQTSHIISEDLNKNLLDFLVSQNIFKKSSVTFFENCRSLPFKVSVRIDAEAKDIAHPSPSKLRPEIFLSFSNFK